MGRGCISAYIGSRKLKIVFLQNQLLHYRLAFYEELSKDYEITVIHSGKKITKSYNSFKEIIIHSRKLGPLYYQPKLFSVLKNLNPDKVVAMFDIRWISILVCMILLDRSLDWIWWGLDKGKSKISLIIKKFILLRRNKVIFYSKKIRDSFLGTDFDHLFFFTNNSIDVPLTSSEPADLIKDSIINVGSLVQRKENLTTIKYFSRLTQETQKKLYFHIVGSGPQENILKNYCQELNIDENVIFHGHIEKYEQLTSLYERSFASVSYGQAGLAVPQSMGFGVPFITKKNAISGGEIHNIVDSKNGFLLEDEEDLLEKLRLLLKDTKLQMEMSRFSKDYYKKNCSIKSMTDDFRNLFEII